MLTGRGLLAWVLAVGLLSGTRISAQAGLSEPISGSPLRKAVLDGLRPEMEKTFGTEIQFVVKTIRVSPSWAFVEVEPRHKDGTAFDAKKIFGGDADHMDGMAVGAVLELSEPRGNCASTRSDRRTCGGSTGARRCRRD